MKQQPRNFFTQEESQELLLTNFGKDKDILPSGRGGNSPELKALLKKMFKFTKKGLRLSDVQIAKFLNKHPSTIHHHRHSYPQ